MLSQFVFEICIILFMIFLGSAVALIIAAIFKGPGLEDRVVAVDLFGSVILSSIALYAIHNNSEHYLTAALVLALFSFVGTVVLARFIQNEGRSRS